MENRMSKELSYQDFLNYVKENIKSQLPEEYEKYSVDIKSVVKNNGLALDGLLIHSEEEGVSPTIYLNEIFAEYQKNGNIEGTLETISNIYVNAVDQVPDLNMFTGEMDLTSEEVKGQITFRLIGYEANKDMLETMPYQKVEDMAMTYHLIATQSEDGIGSIRITNQLMQEMGLSKQELHTLAMENTMRMYPPTLKSMSEVMGELLFGIPSQPKEMNRDLPEDTIYVLSNVMGINGASTLLYPKLQEEIAESLGSNYYVLPSSIHEVLVVPDHGKMEQQELLNMVKEVNVTCVATDEVLTDNVYHYDQNERILTPILKPKEKEQERKASVKESLQKVKEEKTKVVNQPKVEKKKVDMER